MRYAIRPKAKAKGWYLEDGEGKRVALRLRRGEEVRLSGMYWERMRIEEAFRDLKSRLGMVNLMSKTRENAKKTLRLLVFIYALGMVIGEAMRGRERGEKGELGGVSGGTILASSSLLKAPGRFPLAQWRAALGEALQTWRCRLLPPQLVGT